MKERETPLIDKKLLNLLVCPVTGEKLELCGDKLVGKSYSYKIQDGVPIMTAESQHKTSKETN